MLRSLAPGKGPSLAWLSFNRWLEAQISSTKAAVTGVQ
jgi:hypothetical protein